MFCNFDGACLLIIINDSAALAVLEPNVIKSREMFPVDARSCLLMAKLKRRASGHEILLNCLETIFSTFERAKVF